MVGWRLPQSLPVVVDEAVVSHLGGLADDNPHAVVNDQATAQLGPGVNFDSCPEPAPLGHEPGQEFQVVHIEEMGQAVIEHRVDAGIEQKDLQTAPGRRVSGLVRT